MLNIELITISKSSSASKSNEFEKRLSAYCDFNVREIKPAKIAREKNANEIKAALLREEKLILQEILNSDYVIAMCVEGKNVSSEEFSKNIETLTVSGKSKIVFIIGSSNGLSENIKDRANLKLSMSKMTFNHEMARLMLTEQLYRAFQIQNNGKYHK